MKPKCLALEKQELVLHRHINEQEFVPKSTNPANWNYGRFGLAEKTNDECMA